MAVGCLDRVPGKLNGKILMLHMENSQTNSTQAVEQPHA